MSTTLRNYQISLKKQILASWQAGNKNVLAVLPTGAGKTVIFSSIIAETNAPSCAIAHRRELVGQISLALASNGVKHHIIAPDSVRREIIGLHVREVGRSFYDSCAKCGVAGVDTIIRRGDQLSLWLKAVKLWVIDEAHHITKKNKWGRAVTMFPNARGLGVTATPMRTDGLGLGQMSDGVFNDLIVGTNMRHLINSGYLTDYRIYAPPSDLNLDSVKVTTSGEYSHKPLVSAVQHSHIVGDVVEHYKKIACGKLGVTFVTDVDTASQVASRFNSAGVPADMVCAKTSDMLRVEILRRFRNREIMQLVNVDLFGEGFDLPAIEVVSMARPTQSYGLFAQQFGRALRPMEGKTHAIIIDHAGNVMRHGLPDSPRSWGLMSQSRKSDKTPQIPVKTCIRCTSLYLRIYKCCPWCGYYDPPQSRTQPEHTDGSLIELNAETLKKLREKADAIFKDAEELKKRLLLKKCPQIGILTACKRHYDTQTAQIKLREAIALWGGYNKAEGKTDDEGHRLFFHIFGIDVLSAQSLSANQAVELMKKIEKNIEEKK